MRRFELFFRALLLPLDYCLVFLAFLLGYFLRNWLNEVFIQPFPQFLHLALIFPLLWLCVFALLKLYSLGIKRGSLEEAIGIVIGSLSAATLASASIYFFHQLEFSRLVLLATTFLAMPLVWLGRLLTGLCERALMKRGFGVKKVLLVGEGAEAIQVEQVLVLPRTFGQKIVGRVSFKGFEEAVLNLKPDEVIVAEMTLPSEAMTKMATLCEDKGIRFKFIPDIYQLRPSAIAADTIADFPLIELRTTALEGWTAMIKRLTDFVCSLIALFVISPLLLMTALAIKLEDGGPVIFEHERVGQYGKRFFLLKFRSMKMYKVEGQLVHAEEYLKVNEVLAKKLEESPCYKLPDDPRVSKVGRFIRKTSIDELPQFLNVLKGEMSIVGPRAYIGKELDKQLETYPQTRQLVRRLLTVKPGITGLWQVSGRSNLEFSERVALDAYYATRINLLMDLKLMLRTIPVVLRGSGAM